MAVTSCVKINFPPTRSKIYRFLVLSTHGQRARLSDCKVRGFRNIKTGKAPTNQNDNHEEIRRRLKLGNGPSDLCFRPLLERLKE
jgi:hypothetical protein